LTGIQLITMTATLLGAVGLWLILPRASLRGRMAGTVLTAIALGLFASLFPGLGNWVYDSLFFILAGVTVIAAIATVTLQNPVYSAIWFGLVLLGTAGLFLLQGAQFLAVATVVVYAGAILVTFLFVLMLANPSGRAPYDRISWEAMVSAASGAVIIGILTMVITSALAGPDGLAIPMTATREDRNRDVLADDHVARLGAELFGPRDPDGKRNGREGHQTRSHPNPRGYVSPKTEDHPHLIAVEVAGTLLLAALVGAAVIVAQSQGSERKTKRSGESSEGPES
jgi:NADH-quinone oxidoreductase subunit J